MSADEILKQAEQQMLMARPWDAAEEWSIWSITGKYRGGDGTFTDCLAVVLPRYTTGSDQPLFRLVGPLDDLIAPAEITHAAPLLLVHRDNPGTAYWDDDQVWLTTEGGESRG